MRFGKLASITIFLALIAIFAALTIAALHNSTHLTGMTDE